MATIRKEFHIATTPEAAWDALRDPAALHTRLCPAFVTGTTFDGSVREVTFANGMVAQEAIVSIDDASRRIAYAILSDRLFRHMASAQVFPEGGGVRFVWQADVLPHEAAATMEPMMDAGAAAIKEALEAQARAA